VGLEPTLRLDEEARYITALHQWRRINAGDDLTDMAGYGLYLLRMPVSIMPGPETYQGKGAIVSMEARHELTPDLLENTFRDVSALDVTYSLTQIINEDLHNRRCNECVPKTETLTKTVALQKAAEAKLELEKARCKESEAAHCLEHALMSCHPPNVVDPLLEAARQDFATARASRIQREAELAAAEAAIKTATSATVKDALDRFQKAHAALQAIDKIAKEQGENNWVQCARQRWGDERTAAQQAYGLALLANPAQTTATPPTSVTNQQRPQRPPMNGGGPNSFAPQDLRIILGPVIEPKTDTASPDHGGDDQTKGEDVPVPSLPPDSCPPLSEGTSATLPVAPAFGVPTGVAAPTEVPGTPSGISRPAPTGAQPGPTSARQRTRDNVQRVSYQADVRSATAREQRATLTDRLKFLDDLIRQAQEEPGPHDSITMGIIRSALIDAWAYMRANSDLCYLFQRPYIDALGELLRRRDYPALTQERENYLTALFDYRHGPQTQNTKLPYPGGGLVQFRPGSAVAGSGTTAQGQVVSASKLVLSDVLSFVLLLQSTTIDRQIKEDMRIVADRRGFECGDVQNYCFYEFRPSPESQQAFNNYVANKWPLHIYAVDPVIDQQNVLDAFSQRTELQLALATAVATGTVNIKNATSYARQLDLDLATIGLNRTAVGFGAGETTFGWMFYPRVQTPPSVSNLRKITEILSGCGTGLEFDLRHRRIEPGQRECVALVVTPNFIPALRINTVANWFDVAGHCATRHLNNREMLEYGHKVQAAKNALTRLCDPREYRPSDYSHIRERLKQLENLLPTHDTCVDLPDEGDLLGSEIFSSNAAGLAPTLLAWYGEPVQEGEASSIFLLGRGYSVFETTVIAGGYNIADDQKRLISRNVMQIVIPPKARVIKVPCQGATSASASGSAKPATAPGAPATAAAAAAVPASTSPAASAAAAPKTCERLFIDVHIATPNGISNDLHVDVEPKSNQQQATPVQINATTTLTHDGPTTTTSTTFQASQPGVALPPLTVLPLATQWPPETVLAPGTATPAPKGSLVPGMIPQPDKSETAPASLYTTTPPPTTPNTTTPPASTTSPAAPAAGAASGKPTPAAPAAAAAPASTPPAPSVSLLEQPTTGENRGLVAMNQREPQTAKSTQPTASPVVTPASAPPGAGGRPRALPTDFSFRTARTRSAPDPRTGSAANKNQAGPETTVPPRKAKRTFPGLFGSRPDE
jgi:hypothetical protein